MNRQRGRKVGQLVTRAALVATLIHMTCTTWLYADTGPWAFELPSHDTHWYKAIDRTFGITWIAASNAANEAGGYLATIGSQQENDFIYRLVDDMAYWNIISSSNLYCGPWLGGIQLAGSPEPDQGWSWITGEAFSFTNWSPHAPDNYMGSQNCLSFGTVVDERVSTWDDYGELSSLIHGYIIEYDQSPRTVGLQLANTNSFDGYTLFAPLTDTNTYLINLQGQVVNSWSSFYTPGNVCYLLTNGCLLRTATISNDTFNSGGKGGRVERYDWDGNLEWAYEYSSSNHLLHHDVEYLPNGHILMLAWESKTAVEAVQQGRNPAMLKSELWAEHILEVTPTGTFGGDIEWEWHAWDHLIQDFNPAQSNYGVVADHPERININFSPDGNIKDWCHGNGLAYNPDLDQIILSLRNLSEFWVIDHSTTSEEAAGTNGGLYGKGGDLLYRWGNPQSYDRGTTNDRTLFVQHNAHWIADDSPGAGHILIFNNGDGRPGSNYTSIDEIAPPLDLSGNYTSILGQAYGPTNLVWSYTATPPGNFYASYISGVQRLPNGNTFICNGTAGHFFEVTDAGDTVWSYINPIESSTIIPQGNEPTTNLNTAFRAYRYGTNYPAFNGRLLTPDAPIETYTMSSDYDGDGMADQWEVIYGLNPGVASDGPQDADGDGISNADEYQADTNPKDSNEWFHIATLIPEGQTGMVTVASSPNRWYHLEYTTNLLQPDWSMLPDGIATQGTGGTIPITFPIQQTNRFYRVNITYPVPQ